MTQWRPEIVTLCGSTRFADEFSKQQLLLSLEGKIVLSIAILTPAVRDAFGLPDAHYGEELNAKAVLDELHLRKIDLSNSILVLNVGGYIGDSTRREIAYAERQGKTVRYLETSEASGPCPVTVEEG